jgi:hypothetical protein
MNHVRQLAHRSGVRDEFGFRRLYEERVIEQRAACRRDHYAHNEGYDSQESLVGLPAFEIGPAFFQECRHAFVLVLA